MATVTKTGDGGVINCRPLRQSFEAGEIIAVQGVRSVNRWTGQTERRLRQFVVIADVGPGSTSIPVYPSIQSKAKYGTVARLPRIGARVVRVLKCPERMTTYFDKVSTACVSLGPAS